MPWTRIYYYGGTGQVSSMEMERHQLQLQGTLRIHRVTTQLGGLRQWRMEKKRRKDGSSRNASLPSSSVTRAACTFHSIWVHLHPCGRHDNSIFGRNEKSWKCVYGNDAGVEERLRIISRDIVAKNAKTNYNYSSNLII